MSGMNPVAQGILASLSSQSTLLMRMRVLSLGKNYDVMDANQRLLCKIGLDSGQNVKGAVVGAAVAQVAGEWVGRWAKRSLTYTYDVTDAQDRLAMQIRKGSGGQAARFDIVDPQTGGNFGHIDLKRSLFGGLKADWIAPNGQPIFRTKGNLLRRKYSLLDAANQEVGRVRHKILAVRDVWQLELNPGVNHLYSAIFAVIIDFEKKM